ncbi:MAG: hypothetical protein LBI78_04365 [Campylobacteraceae bacterium]|nr:hypothetical protein [Campylobacteraceae bacterium]
MDDKKALLAEIASLIEANTKDDTINLDIMEYMSFEEITSIRDSLKKRKENRKEEQKGWYDEWVEKCGV